jgi:hypothetical protein
MRGWGDNIIDKTQINRDIFLGSLRRIELAYKELKTADLGSAGQDKRENFSLVLFHNAKSFLEVVKKNFDKISQTNHFKELYKTVTIIRNYFVHSYEKDFLDQKVVARININHMNNDGLYELEIFDFDTSRKIFSVHYSLDFIYSELQRMALGVQDLIVKEIKKT